MASSLVSWALPFKPLQTPVQYSSSSGKPSSTTTCSQTSNSLSSSPVSSTTQIPRMKSLEGCSHSVEQMPPCSKATSTSRASPRQPPAARSGCRLYPVRHARASKVAQPTHMVQLQASEVEHQKLYGRLYGLKRYRVQRDNRVQFKSGTSEAGWPGEV